MLGEEVARSSLWLLALSQGLVALRSLLRMNYFTYFSRWLLHDCICSLDTIVWVQCGKSPKQEGRGVWVREAETSVFATNNILAVRPAQLAASGRLRNWAQLRGDLFNSTEWSQYNWSITSQTIELELNTVLRAAGMWGKKKRTGQKEQFIPLQHRQDSKSTFDAQIDDVQSIV